MWWFVSVENRGSSLYWYYCYNTNVLLIQLGSWIERVLEKRDAAGFAYATYFSLLLARYISDLAIGLDCIDCVGKVQYKDVTCFILSILLSVQEWEFWMYRALERSLST